MSSHEEAEKIVRNVLPPLTAETVLADLDQAAEETARHQTIHAIIRRCAAEDTPAETWMAIRDGLASRRWMSKSDFAEAYREHGRKIDAHRDRAQRATRAAEATGDLYRAGDDGCLYYQPVEGEPRMIASFVPQVVADVERDDGAERTRMFRVRVTLPSGRSGEVDVPPVKLADPVDWAARAAGVKAVVLAVPGAREHVRAAAQLLASDSLESRTVYTHTGWRQVAGHWLYLSAAGALGAAGPVDSVLVDLPGKLEGYYLPDPAEDDVQAAVRASLGILDVAPAAVTVPILAAAYRAPLPLPSDGSVFVEGRTGEGKSQLAALAAQHFGAAMDSQHLPGSWSATGNALAELAFLLADALFVVDDYVPTGNAADVAKLRRTAEQLLRGAANGAGRDRLDATAALRAARPPRAQILATGEDLPSGQSLRGRMFTVVLEKGALNWKALTGHQQRGADGTFALAMAGYVRWLAGELDAGTLTVEGLRAERVALRTKAASSGQHRRTPDMIASLVLGWKHWLDFATAIGAISSDTRKAHADQVWNTLLAGADDQADGQQDMDPVQIYLDSLTSAIATGSAHLSRLDGSAPKDSAAWGWEQVMSGENFHERGRGTRIGWISDDGQHAFLEPAAAYTVAVRRVSVAGLPVLPADTTLRKRLHEAGRLAGTEVRDKKLRLTVRQTVDGKRRAYVLHLLSSDLGVGGE